MTAGADTHVEDDDEPDTFACYRHPDRETALRCKDCDRPICVDCAVQGAVGIKCPDCARTSRAARAVVPTAKLVRGIAVAAVVAGLLGSILAIAPTSFFGIILAYLAGHAVGEVARRASGGYRDPMLARAAAVCAAIGILALPALDLLARGGRGFEFFIWDLLAAIAAAVGAFQRAS